ncbi:MAG: metallophosphoesterase family protein [Planctomycetales bacterium]|nr:metallophosphoesterase family protein [Planctomycetales bacterium]
MKIGVLSDTHGRVAQTRAAVELLLKEQVEVLIHCGDLNTREIVETCSVLPFYFAFGNHDSDMTSELRRAATELGVNCLGWGGVIELASRRIGIHHGHMRVDRERVERAAPDYLLTGHTHEAADVRDILQVDGVFGGVPTRRINPGALYRAKRYTVATLDLNSDQLEFLEVVRVGRDIG